MRDGNQPSCQDSHSICPRLLCFGPATASTTAPTDNTVNLLSPLHALLRHPPSFLFLVTLRRHRRRSPSAFTRSSASPPAVRCVFIVHQTLSQLISQPPRTRFAIYSTAYREVSRAVSDTIALSGGSFSNVIVRSTIPKSLSISLNRQSAPNPRFWPATPAILNPDVAPPPPPAAAHSEPTHLLHTSCAIS